MQEELSSEIARLKSQVEELERSIKLRDDFLAGIAHDIRQPLSAMYTTIEFLVEATEIDLPSYYQEALEASLRASRSANDLIEQLSIFRQYESGRLPSECGPRHLAIEIKEAVESLRCQQYKGSSADLQIADIGMDARAWADPRWLRRILVNLLSNAIKFTRDGIITVSVESTEDNVRILISDTGPGIPPEDLEYIFEPYKQLGNLRGEGLGLGLYLCRVFAREMMGDLTVESELGKGSTFTITLPINAPI